MPGQQLRDSKSPLSNKGAWKLIGNMTLWRGNPAHGPWHARLPPSPE